MNYQTIPIQVVRQIILGAQHRGLDTTTLLQRSGVAPALIESHTARITLAQCVRIIRRIARSTGDDFWGLTDTQVPLGTFSQCCRLLLHSRTLGDALQEGFRFYHGILNDFVPRIRVENGLAYVWTTTRMPGSPRLDYGQRVFVFFTLGLACWLIARRIPPSWVDYVETQPGLEAELYRVFQTPVHYARPHFGFVLDAKWLQMPIVQDRHGLDAFLGEAPAGLLVRYRDETDLTERIRRLLRSHLHDEMPPMETVAGLLTMTPQTLRRRLAECGKSYRILKEDLRRDVAIELLAREGLTLLDIAEQLGFSEASTFNRAFKGWTGVPPGEYRRTETG